MNWIWPCALFFSPGLIAQTGGHTPETVLSTADSLFKCEKYQRAAIEYERIIFLTESYEEKQRAYLAKSECYKQQRRFNEAIYLLEKLPIQPRDSLLQRRVWYELALCNYLAKNIGNADDYIYQIQQKYKKLHPNEGLLNVLVLNELNNWTEAKQAALLWGKGLEHLPHAQKDSLVNWINQWYDEEHLPKGKRINLARRLSLFPGLGQMYAGNWGRGTASLLLTTSALGFGIWQFYEGFYITGYFVGIGLFQRFYVGGMRHAAFLAQKRNHFTKRQFNDELKSKLAGYLR